MEKYEIIIKKDKTKKKTNVSGEDEKEKKSAVAGEDQEAGKDKDYSEVSAKIIAKTALNEVKGLIVPRIGEWTRNSLFEAKINDAMSLIDTAASFAVNPVYGAINLSTKMIGNVLTQVINNEKAQNKMNVSMRRASYINRSRD